MTSFSLSKFREMSLVLFLPEKVIKKIKDLFDFIWYIADCVRF